MTNKGFLTKSKDKSLIFMELQKRDFETLWKHGLKKNVCPVCSVPDHKQEFEKYGLRYVRCISCNVVYPLEYFKDIDLLDYYRNGESINYFMEEILEPSIERRKRVIYPQRIELIEKFKKRGKVLEVGCASGDFLTCFDRSRWEVFGVEINQKAVRSAREVNRIDVYDGEITDEGVFDKNFFDVIVIWEVLPFVNRPRDIVRSCIGLLSPNGLLLIGHPNFDCMEYRLRGKNAHFINCFMRNMFNASNTLRLLNGADYTVIDFTNVGFEIVSFMSGNSLSRSPVFKWVAHTLQVGINRINWGNLLRCCLQVD